MNKIVIIGNGFDISHNQFTRYNDFLNYIRDSVIVKEILSSSSYRPKILGQRCKRGHDFVHKLTEEKKEDPWLGARISKSSGDIELATNPHANKNSIYFKSLISDQSLNGYWSDLEYHYFKVLVKHSKKESDIETINEEFEHMKRLLFSYLKNEVEDKIGTQDGYQIDENHSIFRKLEEDQGRFDFNHIFFVNFNYTSKILNTYISWLMQLKGKDKIHAPINIHGDLTDPTNPIIFGYGDDNSEEYRGLQELKTKSLLKNFKTFQYLRSNRYRQVLGYLETAQDLYVQILGHSCDMTDKALLRTMFQHPNVKYIETAYHETEDRYFEKLYNISRIFDDTSLMRKKLVPLEESFKIQ